MATIKEQLEQRAMYSRDCVLMENAAELIGELESALIEARDALKGAPNTVGLHNQINKAISKSEAK